MLERKGFKIKLLWFLIDIFDCIWLHDDKVQWCQQQQELIYVEFRMWSPSSVSTCALRGAARPRYKVFTNDRFSILPNMFSYNIVFKVIYLFSYCFGEPNCSVRHAQKLDL